jgi:hypothetical protein
LASPIVLSLYYWLKPVIPREVVFALRKALARRKVKKVSSFWPIDPKAGKPPPGWRGWPGGKRFAFVLTHDVETAQGQRKCVKLAQLEMDLGFRSSFNFVAEGYDVDRKLHGFLTENGFEIGVHGLKHSGNMLVPAKRFFSEAPRINHYLRAWGAVGFRAPSMYREFSLIHYLDILYDSSSFDVDPFEPLGRGLETIFPVFISNSHNSAKGAHVKDTKVDSRETLSGFVELPYTLPQDHTLFLVLGEKDTSIWKRKLHWICEKGGMALLNVHPDYMRFDSGENPSLTYPCELYREFLEHVRSHYEGLFWHALPKEIAAFVKEHLG